MSKPKANETTWPVNQNMSFKMTRFYLDKYEIVRRSHTQLESLVEMLISIPPGTPFNRYEGLALALEDIAIALKVVSGDTGDHAHGDERD